METDHARWSQAHAHMHKPYTYTSEERAHTLVPREAKHTFS